MSSHSVIDSRLWIRLDLGDAELTNSNFQSDSAQLAHFAAQLLVYDKIVIPTKDFSIIPILISWMGLSDFEEALESGVLGFIRPDFLLAYVGHGNGIQAITIKDTPEKPFRWWQEAIFGDVDSAIRLQLEHKCAFIEGKQRSKMARRILSRTKVLRGEDPRFAKAIVEESNSDILGHRELLSRVTNCEPPGVGRLSRLSGVMPDQARFLAADGVLKDGVDLVLRVAEINLELMMAHDYDQSDLSTSEGAEEILQNKLVRLGLPRGLLEGFISLLELEAIPDIRPAVKAGTLPLPTIWKLRNQRASVNFRRWLREAECSDSRELEKAYVAAIGASAMKGLGVRALRFVLVSAFGLLNPIVGTLASATDSFFLDKWMAGYTPKLFLESLRRIKT